MKYEECKYCPYLVGVKITETKDFYVCKFHHLGIDQLKKCEIKKHIEDEKNISK